ncbi:MAG TPA: hypothetical protein VEK15_25955 [Vicinamibacteria bacterium]|nr:hypothetical protein [Vicinamibacteria bacterium]
MSSDIALTLAVTWVAAAGLAFVSGLIRRFHVWQWLALSLVLGPFALLLAIVLTGRGYQTSLFAKPSQTDATPAPRIPSDDELLSGEKTAFKNEIVAMTQSGQLDEAERMLETLIDVVEEKARKQDRGVPHWYYEQLATVYRKRGNRKAELRTLERWARLPHAAPAKAEARLERRLAKLKSERKLTT